MNVGRAIHDRKQEVGSWTCTGSWSQRVRCFFFAGVGGGGVTLLFVVGEMRGEEVELYYTIPLKKLTKTVVHRFWSRHLTTRTNSRTLPHITFICNLLLKTESHYTSLMNHPDLVGILKILLENHESWRICDRDRKNPDFDICLHIFKWILRIKSNTPKGVLNWKWHPENLNIPLEI